MKQSRICPKCRHNRILYIEQVSDQTGEWGNRIDDNNKPEPERQKSLPFRIARLPAPAEGFFGSPTRLYSAGLVEAYVCKGCGYTEFYTKDPSQIPVDGKYVRELVGPESTEPFR